MATYTIEYLVNVGEHSTGGNYDSPAPQGHPPYNLYCGSSLIAANQGGDTVVQIPKESHVRITMTDTSQHIFSEVEPSRLTVGRWNNQTPTVAMMIDDALKPIDTPVFDVHFTTMHKLDYQPSQPTWEEDNNPTFNEYMSGVMIGDEARVTTDGQIIQPYIGFNTQQHTGTLWFGLEYCVVKGGSFRKYWWFDPYIQIV